MSQFLIRWVEEDNKVYFLTYDQIYNSERGREFQKYNGNDDDLTGHGAIKWFYKLKNGKDREQVDFSKPSNFPPEIVAALKEGAFNGLGVAEGLLLERVFRTLADDFNAKFWELFAYPENREKAWR